MPNGTALSERLILGLVTVYETFTHSGGGGQGAAFEESRRTILKL